MAKGRSVTYTYNLKDKFSKSFRKFKVGMKRQRRLFKRNKDAAKAYSRQMDKVKNSIKNFGSSIFGALGATAGMALALIGAVRAASNFADSMSDVNKVMDLKQKGQFGQFRKDILKMAPVLATMPSDLAKMAYQGAKVGVAKKEMAGFLRVVVKTKAAFDMTAETAGSAIGDIKAKLGLSIGDSEKLLSQVNYMADTTRANGRNMLDIIARVSARFKLMKFDSSQIAAFAAAADMISVSSELAASGMRMAFRRLSTSPIYAKKFHKAPVETFMSILDSLKKMDPAMRAIKVKKLFGDEAGEFVVSAVENIKAFRDNLKAAKTDAALKSMDKEFAAFLKRSSTGFLQLKIKFMKIFIKIGDILLAWFEANKGWINWIIDNIGDLVNNYSWVIEIAMIMAGVFMTIIAVVLIYIGVMSILTMITTAFGLASLAALWPIILVIGAIVLVVYGLYKAYQYFTGNSAKGVDKLTESMKKLNATRESQKFGSMYAGKGVQNSYKTEMMRRQQTNVSGEINVSADKGSTITKNKINIDQGSNTDFDFYTQGIN